MNDNGTFGMENRTKENHNWDITLIDNEITLFSNGYYLGYDENSNKIVSDKYMRRWNFTKTKNEMYLIKTNNDFLISINGNTLYLKPNDHDINNVNNNTIFQFIDTN